LLPLADTGLSLYRTSADLEHGRHFTALPTAWVTGIEKADKVFIGSGVVWQLPENSKVGFLEFNGQGLQSLEKAVIEKKELLASLGSQLLQSKKTGVETADAVRLRQNAEASTLVTTVKIVEQGITQLLQSMAAWGNVTGDITVKMNTDFVDSRLSASDLTALVSTWQSGGISHDTLLYNLKRGEILEPGTDIEAERNKIEIQAGESEQE
jgi:hypothetical protein